MTEATGPVARSRGRHTLALFAFLAVVLVLSFLVFRPFLIDMTVAGAVAILLAPVHGRLTRAFRGRASLSALVLVVLTTVAILLPFSAAVTILGQQAVAFVEWSAPKLQPTQLQQLINETLPERYPWLRTLDSDTVSQIVSGGLSRLVSGLNRLVQSLVGRVTGALLDVLLFTMLLFFMLRDGGRLRDALRKISPLSEEQERGIFDHLGKTVKGVLQAMILVPIAQGVVAAPAFALLGVPSPLLWAFGVVLAAFVPILGSPLGWVPAALYLFVEGHTGRAVALTAYGIVFISGIDNVVKPLLLRGAAQIHPLLAFLAVLGGAVSFGPSGVLIGPVILSLLLSAVRIYGDFVEPRDAPAPTTSPRAPASQQPEGADQKHGHLASGDGGSGTEVASTAASRDPAA